MAEQCQPDKFEKLESVADLVEIAGRLKASTVAVAGGDRLEDLRLVESARDHGIIDRIVLIGNQGKIEAAVQAVDIEIAEEDIVHAESDNDVAAQTVSLIQSGEIDIVLKGNISTPIINRHMLPLATRSTVSLASIFDAAPIANGRPTLLTDAGVTTICNFGRLADLIDNAVDVARTVMGIDKPKVAVLSANEKQIPSLPSTWLADKLTQREWKQATVYGPLSFDLATDPQSVAIKGLPDLPLAREVAGHADILVCPGIDAANILYKSIAAMSKYGLASIAGITIGFPVPYIILSRSDSLETRLESIALCSIYAQRKALKARKEEHTKPISHPTDKPYRILVVNPGSTSLKLALFENESCSRECELTCELNVSGSIVERSEQVVELRQLIEDQLSRWECGTIDAIAARGGFLPRPEEKLASGIYTIASVDGETVEVNQDIVSGVLEYPEMQHASNFAIPVAARLAGKFKVPAFTVNPVVVDEFSAAAELSGYALITRKSTAHALSVFAAARKAGENVGRALEDINLVVAHLGGGFTIAALQKGRMVDNSIALLGEGPFTPQRSGVLPLDELIELGFSGKLSKTQLKYELTKNAGLKGYLGEDRMEVLEQRIAEGDEPVRQIVDGMIYQIAGELGRYYVLAGSDVDAIVLTGGLMRSKYVRTSLRRRIGRLAPVLIYTEPLEMAALAGGALDVLTGRRQAGSYRLPEQLQKEDLHG